MSLHPLEYVPAVADESAFLQDLSKALPVVLGRMFQHQRTLLDSFDGRLYRDGWILEESRQGRHREWILRSLPRGLEVHRMEIAGTVRFASQLPPGPLQSRLLPLLEGRALLPCIRLLVKTQSLKIGDDQSQGVVFAEWETFVWDAPAQDPRPALPGRLVLRPGAGGEEAILALANQLREGFGLSPAGQSLWIHAISYLDTQPGHYSTKLDFHFQAEDRAEVVFRHISGHLLDILETNIPGVLADTDEEFLHDVRVAVRRTRVVLARMEGILAPESSDRFQKEFAWLQAVSGPVRDWDVYRQQLPRYHAILPVEYQNWLEPLTAYLVQERQRARRSLLHALRSERCQRILREWRALLEAPLAFNGETNDQPIARLSSGWIWQQYRKARR
ncbi:MAG: CHAD domain-containing protein, partial [Pseudomonadota bacterium]